MLGWGAVCRAALLVAVLVALTAPTAGAQVPGEFFGVNAGDLFALPESAWDVQLEAIRSGGIATVRLPAVWSNLEPRSPDSDGRRYDSWELIDGQVAALARHGLRWEPVIAFTATWDETVPGDDASAPARVEPFADFVAALARRYGPGGVFWDEHPDIAPVPVGAYELWNEPNASAFWHPQQTAPEAYAELYAAARDAISRVDGSARVVIGGLASPGGGVIAAGRFVARMLARRPDLRGHIDAVAYHPYAPTLAGVYRQLARFRRQLDDAAGPGIPIEITEVGWTTADTPEAARAAALAALARSLPRSDCGVDRLMPYAWIGPEQDPGDRLQWFGIANRDGSARPSAAAFTQAARSMRRTSVQTKPVVLCQPRLRLGLTAVVPRPGGGAGLKVTSACAAECALSLRVTAAHRGDRRTLARRALRFRRGSRSIRLRLSPAAQPGMRLALRAHAWTRTGWRATRVRTIHVPAIARS